MWFCLRLESENDAMKTGEDLAKVLTNVAGAIRSGNGFGDNPILDDNGNKVGAWVFEADP